MDLAEAIYPELGIRLNAPVGAPALDPGRFAQRPAPGIRIRVCGFGPARAQFLDGVHATMVSCTGTRFCPEHEVYADHILRIINLQNYFEAGFRVVGPAGVAGGTVVEWGVESVQKERSIWGIEFLSPPPLPEGNEAGTWVECRPCGRTSYHGLTLMEFEVLNCTGITARFCGQCEKVTYRTYLDVHQRPKLFPPFPEGAPPLRLERLKRYVNTRAHKRLRLRSPILVRDSKGKGALSRAANVSIGGLGVVLSMDLAVQEGDLHVPLRRCGAEHRTAGALLQRRAPNVICPQPQNNPGS